MATSETSSTYPAHMILALRRYLEEDNDPTPDATATIWCDYGWTDPSAAYREWTAIGAEEAESAWELREAGLSITQAGQTIEIDGISRSIAAFYDSGDLTIEEAKQEAGVDPLADLQQLAQDRASAEHALTEIRRLGRIKALAAREQGASVVAIAEAFGVSRQAAYDLLGD